jgi:FG-GAP-like repeat
MPARTTIVSLLVVFVLLPAVNTQGQTIVTGLDAGGAPQVSVFDVAKTAQLASFFAYAPTFSGGVRVATGDVNGDGVADIVTGAGPGGGGHVKVFDGNTGVMVHSFFAFDPAFQGGVFVAAGDLTGDGTADIVVGADAGGGPHVKAFDGGTLDLLDSFFAFSPNFSGGVFAGGSS